MTDDARVAIVGAGPVGLTLALKLARGGVPVSVFEQAPALPPELRASTFHPPSLEMLDTLGLKADEGVLVGSDQKTHGALIAAIAKHRVWSREAAAKAAVADMEAEGSPRLDALRRFAAANDLVEMNVMGALNANLAFYKGLSAGGAFGSAMTEEDMLADVWGQEADVRAETEEWLWSYLSLAYQPLSDEELQAYHDFSETPEGQKLNAAVFAAFDVSFVRISEDLGRAAARAMQGEDI